MLKRIIILLCLLSVCLTACSKNDEKETEVINSNEKETKIKTDSEEDNNNVSKNYYDFLYDPNILWVNDGYSYLLGEDLYYAEKGKVIVYEPFIEFLKKQEDNSEILYAAELGYKNASIHTIYYDFLKDSGIISEFSYKTMDEVQQLLSEKYIIEEKSMNDCYHTIPQVQIYATKEQLISLHNCSVTQDMEIFIRALYWPVYELTQEDIDYYKGDLMPIEYYAEINGKKTRISEVLSKEEVQKIFDETNEVYWDLDVVMDNYNWKKEY